MRNILMILSAAKAWTQKDGSQRPTGFWAEEFVAPHQALTAAGCAITVATPGGKPAVVDALSLSIEVNHGDAAKVAELTAYLDTQADTLRAPRPLAKIELGGFDAVFVPGGHGPMQDLAVDADTGRLLAAAIADPGKLVAAVCHGQAALLAAGDATAWAFRGRRLTGFSNVEETQTGLAANALAAGGPAARGQRRVRGRRAMERIRGGGRQSRHRAEPGLGGRHGACGTGLAG
ncbi:MULTISPECIES: type 1 glutamine amidotransferase domain-containing protein [Burkholderia]|uniref:type 1 glutamine amidotransferase domain-containing protein n=1 Tax=Burkholderia TaxID=32008 RepID=UPI00119C5F9F|nr:MULTISPECIES: type 1 glutamine amidotransferase domain-containing protein [Burkholderia]MDN7739068.1 type 1 glutamine amidotransferase domain-containing protein [Burkholderia gladioli]TWC72294.1 putative intracellular protease/amidase [Burkholderia sp. SJZ089]TWD02324.1 putative intracellular protease/amidase [Burkholderia sp. SJZ115]TWD06972.1 putative intracellular protease/amidase [Burkholderia sp. SJZ091]